MEFNLIHFNMCDCMAYKKPQNYTTAAAAVQCIVACPLSDFALDFTVFPPIIVSYICVMAILVVEFQARGYKIR